jgi:mannosylglycerate synthase
MGVFRKNICEAASHPRVDAVLCVGYEKNACYKEIETAIPEIEKENNKEIRLILQERLGDRRPGKGDGMNTALKYFLEETDYERLHFYDSDIETFSQKWITQAELPADDGYQVVRHYFPRASTDAMVTWMITKTGFAILWPNTELPFIEQPLGGELLLTREVAARLYEDKRSIRQSDWGIDTAYTWIMVTNEFSLYETYVPIGKVHKLYKTLADLQDMAIECFATIQQLKGEKVDTVRMVHRVERPGPVPDRVKEKTAYDLEGSLHLLMEGWSDKQLELLNHFPQNVREGMAECQRKPRFTFMDAESWYRTYEVLLEHFDPADEDWRELFFKLWIARVLNYTTKVALRGYDYALFYLYQMVEGFVRMSKEERSGI